MTDKRESAGMQYQPRFKLQDVYAERCDACGWIRTTVLPDGVIEGVKVPADACPTCGKAPVKCNTLHRDAPVLITT